MWADARTESFFGTMRINWVVLFVFYFRDDALFPVWIWGWVCDEVNLRTWIWVDKKTMRLFQLLTSSFRISLCKWISILESENVLFGASFQLRTPYGICTQPFEMIRRVDFGNNVKWIDWAGAWWLSHRNSNYASELPSEIRKSGVGRVVKSKNFNKRSRSSLAQKMNIFGLAVISTYSFEGDLGFMFGMSIVSMFMQSKCCQTLIKPR